MSSSISSSSSENANKESYLYLGTLPKKRDDDIIASFTGRELVPISWYFLFKPEDMRKRREEFPEQLSNFNDQGESLDSFEQFVEDPVAFKTSLPDAKARIAEYREAFKSIPYIWSYFKVIDILDNQIENFIHQLENKPDQVIIQRKSSPHPETTLSQVAIEKNKSRDSTDNQGEDNPFAALEDFGTELSETIDQSKEPGSGSDNLETLSDDDLLNALQEAAALDFEQQEEEEKEKKEIEEDHQVKEGDELMPVVAYFDEIATGGRGERMGRIPLLLERLMHHAKREGEMTRVMQDLLQEIFREALTGWRVTGQLAEDFIQGDISELAMIMLGEPSPYVIIDSNFDLEYWTKGTLQSGDERLMYSLTMLPSEQVHIAIKSGKLNEIADQVGSLLVNTQSVKFKRLTVDLLKKPSLDNNVWGFRVLIKDSSNEFKPATLLISDPNKSWREEFEDNLNLPGVLEDWNIEIPVRFDEFSDIDHYQIVFEGAKDVEETFAGFVRWARRHHIMYIHTFGVDGTIKKLKNILEETNDKQQGQIIFDILTNLTELGFNEATEALSDDAIVRKLPWLYS